MSSRNQALYVGVAVTGAVLVVGYLYMAKSASCGPSKPKRDPHSSRSRSPDRTKKEAFETTTPLVSNTSGRSASAGHHQTDKEIHSKIEELDKAGKQLFKNKRVSVRVRGNFFAPFAD